MAQFQLPSSDKLVDRQVIQVKGPDGSAQLFQFNAETRTLFSIPDTVIIPPNHGQTHVTTDLVPDSTLTLPGLMSPASFAKLQALTQMRLGILGFTGAGFPDDGGFLQGDLILATGSEQLSIERIGNVIRLTVNTPIPLQCPEECAQLFWIVDESDTGSIRPPSCAGRLPGANIYGELKVHLLPEETVFDPADPIPTLSRKLTVPGLFFKRFDDGATPNQGEFEAVLSRNENGVTRVGWAMTPGATGTPEAVWFMGADDDGAPIRFEFKPEQKPGLLGALLYKGHTLTRQMAAVTGFEPNVLTTNQYRCRFWDVLRGEPADEDTFVATNVWRFNNPETSPNDPVAPRALVLDATKDVLPVGTLVQIWEFRIGEVNGERQVLRFFNTEPHLNPAQLWAWSDGISFGDTLKARVEDGPATGAGATVDVDDIRTLERTQWGITGFDNRLLVSDDGEATGATGPLFSGAVGSVGGTEELSDESLPLPNTILFVGTTNTDFSPGQFVGKTLEFTSGSLQGKQFEILASEGEKLVVFGEADTAEAGDEFDIFSEVLTGEPSGVAVNNQFTADVDLTLPGLRIDETDPASDRERPVFLWHRVNHKNLIMSALIGMPASIRRFPPIDILLRAPGDSFDDVFVKVVRRGIISSGPFRDSNFVVVKGIHWKDVPQRGALRILTGLFRDTIFRYTAKVAFDRFDDDATILIGFDEPFPFDDDFTDEGTAGTGGPIFIETPTRTIVASLLHEEFNAPALRLEFSVNDAPNAESVQLQFLAGTLDLAEAYEFNLLQDPSDDLVRGFKPGTVAASRVHTQQGFITATEEPPVTPAGFKVFKGGFLPTEIDGEIERWNLLEIMHRDSQLWIWWNGLLIPPDAEETSKLTQPIPVTTPHFILPSDLSFGKVVFRLWPGTRMRSVEIRDQLLQFSEFTRGQLELLT